MEEYVKNHIAGKLSSLYYFFLYCLYIMAILFPNSKQLYFYQVCYFMSLIQKLFLNTPNA